MSGLAGLAIVLVGISACDDGVRTADLPEFCQNVRARGGVARLDSAGIEIVVNLWPANAAVAPVQPPDSPALTIGVIHGDEAYEFGRIAAAARLSDGRIVVADGQNAELRVFDREGRLVSRHGRRGSGPGEYGLITGLFRTAGDTMWVADAANRRVTTLDPDLAVTGTRPLHIIPWSVVSPETGRTTSGGTTLRVRGVLADGSMIATNTLRTLRTGRVTNVSRDSLILRHVAAGGEQMDSLLMMLGIQRYEYFGADGSLFFGEAPLGNVESLAVGADRFHYGTADRFEIGEYEPDGRLVRLIRICEHNDVIADRELDDVIEYALAQLSGQMRQNQETALRALPRPTRAPAYLDFQVDEMGRLWVRDFTPPGRPQRWRVIGGDGRWLRDVALPEGVDVLYIGGGHILARHTTDMNVHVLHVYGTD